MIMRRWLDAAGITDPELRRCYTMAMKLPAVGSFIKCRAMLSLWPADRRPYMIAISAVGALGDIRADHGDPSMRRRRVDEWAEAVFAAVAAGHSDDPVLHAFAHTSSVWELRTCFLEELFDAWRRDAGFTPFATYEELRSWAQAASGGSVMYLWPIVGFPGTTGAAEPMVRRLAGMAQISDNLFDLADDLRNGRLFLPLEDLDRFGVEPEDLFRGRWSTAVADLLAFEVARERDANKGASELSSLLLPACRPSLWAALHAAETCLDEALRAGAALLRRVPSWPMHRTWAQFVEWGVGVGGEGPAGILGGRRADLSKTLAKPGGPHGS